MAIGACEACPGLRATVLDPGRVVPIAQRFISEAGLTERITATFCDLTAQSSELTYDVAVLRSFIQVLSPEQAARAIRNIGRSMPPGGEIYILGYVLDDTRSSPWEAAAYDVAFINIYPSSRYRKWISSPICA